jgi:hypothetical protein
MLQQTCCSEVLRLWYYDVLRLLRGMLRGLILRRVLRLSRGEFLSEQTCTE